MKDYIWIIVAGSFAVVSLFFFILTISNSSSLIKRLNKSKLNIITNLTVLLIGVGNIGIIIYLLQDIRKQIESFSSF